jgi:molybdopterin-biosynthesis enzyme MoeA-like protein
LVRLLTEAGYQVSHTAIVPDEMPMIEAELIRASEGLISR